MGEVFRLERTDSTTLISANELSATPQGPTPDELLVSIATHVSGLQNQLDHSNERVEYLVQLFQQARPKQGLGTLTSYSYPIPAVYKYLITQEQRKEELKTKKDVTAIAPQVASVPLHRVLEFGAVLLAFVCAAGISSWLLNDSPLVSPFAAILGLLASPFFYLMGRAVR